MIKHYLTIAIRNLTKQKVLTFINIFGLSIGVACFSLFVLYAINEFSFDRFHKDKDNIYRAYRFNEDDGGSTYLPIPFGPAAKQDIPDIKNFVRFKGSWTNSFIKVDGKVSSAPITFADPQVFSVFTFPFKYGNPVKSLSNMKSVVLTEKIARNLFSIANPIGKIIEIKVEDKFEPFEVSGVCEDIPSNSTITFDILGSFDYFLSTEYGKRGANEWRMSGFQTYLQLKEGSQLMANSKPLQLIFAKYHPDELANRKKAGHWNNVKPPKIYGLQKLSAMHTDTKIAADKVIDPKNIWILVSIAFGILLIACINFTTLAIGRSASRTKEVGLRKVIGSTRKSLVAQFLTEAVILSILSSLLGIMLAKILLPFFNELSGTELKFSFVQFPEMIWFLIGLTLAVGLLAGSYPALVLSSFKPIEILLRKLKFSGSNIFTRSLVTVQFVLSFGLIVSTVIILQQLSFMRSKNPGFNKENILVVDAEQIDTKRVYPLFRQSLLMQPGIKGVAGSELGLGEGMGWSRSSFEYNKKQKDVYEYFIDDHFLDVMGISLLTGRNIDPKISSDTASIIINEAMMKDFGWTLQNAVGQQLKGYSEQFSPVVIGVVKDFNFLNFKEKMSPQMFHHFADRHCYKYFIRMEAGDPSKTIASIEKKWKELEPEIPMKYSFLDEDLDQFYKSEARWGAIVGWGGGISIFLACLGLFGLASLASVNRIKEIGIRKILGASILNITQLFSKNFVKLILVAIVIATPLTWYFMNQWLQNFAYKIQISWWIFAIVGVLAIAISILTISFQSIKTAIANPVKSLRTE